jgi:hypothetical protein
MLPRAIAGIDTHENAMTDETQPIPKATEKPAKKRYEPPRILSMEPLEAIAAVCRGGTSKNNPGQCPKGPISS